MTDADAMEHLIVTNAESRSEVAVPDPKHRVLIRAGCELHKYGTPSHRLERVLVQLARSQGLEGTFLYTPTALILHLIDESGAATYVQRVDSGPVDVDKLIRFDEALERLEDHSWGPERTIQEIDLIAGEKPSYSQAVTVCAAAATCAAVAALLRGGVAEVVVAGLVGLLVALLELLPAKFNWESGLIGPLAGFAAAVTGLAVGRFLIPLDDRLVTLAGLIVLLPGLSITVALTELAVGHLSAGVARLAGAGVSLLTLTIGVALAWRMAGHWRVLPALPVEHIPAWGQWIAIALAPVCFAIVFHAKWRQWPVIIAVSVAGYVASLLAGDEWGLEAGAFCGAAVVGIGSNLYARLRDRPALVTLTPGIIVLVPGSIGYRSLTAFLDRETLAGVDFAFNMLIVAAALVGGILIANVVLPPKRIL